MATFSNNMIITNSSLTEISKEVIAKRTFKPDKITKVGEPQITKGYANGFSDYDYFLERNIEFAENYESITVSIEAQTDSLDTNQCLWRLFGSSNLSLYVTSSAWIIKERNTDLVILNGLDNRRQRVKVSAKFTPEDCTVSVTIANKIYNATVNLVQPLDFTLYNTLILGTDGTFNNAYWGGGIELAEVAISQDNQVIYTPSIEPNFSFKHLLISDGEYPLNDGSNPMLGHVFQCDITEITRTGNNVLLTSTIPKEDKLLIKEMGLYIEDATGTHLFSLISNLSLNKKADVSYNLIMDVKIDVNVVNTVAFPEIIIKEQDYIKYTDFKTVKDVYEYTCKTLDDMVLLNSLALGTENERKLIAEIPEGPARNFLSSIYYLYDKQEPETLIAPTIGGLGYNLPQHKYEEQLDLDMWADNSLASQNFINIRRDFKGEGISWRFNKSLVQTTGNAEVQDSGEGTIFGDAENYMDEVIQTFVILSSLVRYDSNQEAIVAPISAFRVRDEILVNMPASSGRLSPINFQPFTFNRWTAELEFQTSNDLTLRQCLLNYALECEQQPLSLYIENGYCKLLLNGPTVIRIDINGTEKDYVQREMFLVEEDVYYKWVNVEDEEEVVLLGTIQPVIGTDVYNEEETVIGSVTNVTEHPILNETLFQVREKAIYGVELSFNGTEYKVSYYPKNGRVVPVLNYSSTDQIGYVTDIGLGSEYDHEITSSTFSGIIYLNTVDLNFYYYEGTELLDSVRYFFNDPYELYQKEMTDFFHIPEYNHSAFRVNNLEREDSYLEILESTFTGTKDRIDFSSEHGFTLSVKAHLKDTEDKVILAKRDLETDDLYLVLKEEGKAIVLLLYFEDSAVELRYNMNREELNDFIGNPVTYTVILTEDTSPTLKLYRNNNLLDSRQLGERPTLPAVNYDLTNVVPGVNEYEGRVVSDIIGVRGALTEKGLYRVNTVLQTNS